MARQIMTDYEYEYVSLTKVLGQVHRYAPYQTTCTPRLVTTINLLKL